MRPYYCKASDLGREKEVLNRLFNRLQSDSTRFNQGRNYDVQHLGGQQHSSYDGQVFCNGKLYAIVEIKSRRGDSTQYADWHISQNKISKLRLAAAERNVPAWLVFKWDDGIFMADVAKLDMSRTHVSGRTDRNDPDDIETMVLIYATDFKKV